MKITLLSPLQKEQYEDLISTQLSRADDVTMKFSDIEDINEYDIWTAEHEGFIKYFAMCGVLGEAYFVYRVAGSGKLFPWDKFFEAVTPIAKAKDCTEVLFSGSKDWEDKVKHMGFTIKEYTYSVKV